MQILVDADAYPNAIKDILFRAAIRVEIPLVLIANQALETPESELISSIEVSEGPDEADDKIVELVERGDLVITADIPLADRVIKAGAVVITHRGELYTTDNIAASLAVRNIKEDLRSSGINTDGPPPFTQKDSQAFANQLDRFLTKYIQSLGAQE